MKHSKLRKIVLIGASTGGPGHINTIINELPTLQNTSIIIAQHMLKGFVQSFAKRLKSHSLTPVSIIKNKEVLIANKIYICELESFLEFDSLNPTFKVQKNTHTSYNPDINTILSSFVPLCNDIEVLCVILTGIGEDGVGACKLLSEAGSRCITESQESAIVDGMPSRARKLVPNIEVMNIDNIRKNIKEFCK